MNKTKVVQANIALPQRPKGNLPNKSLAWDGAMEAWGLYACPITAHTFTPDKNKQHTNIS